MRSPQPMEWTPEIEDLVEKYFQQELTYEEQKEWQAWMKVPQFRWYVEDRKKKREQALTDENKMSGEPSKHNDIQMCWIMWPAAVLFIVVMVIILVLVFV